MAQGLQKRERKPPAAATKKASAPNDDASAYKLTRRVVARHNAPNDAWVIVRGQVYDITTFLDSHPGGADILHSSLGGDASAAMDGGAHAHSAYAYKLLERYRIGALVGAESPVDDEAHGDASGELPQVDWSKPILPQIGRMGASYERWIHSFPTTDHTVKMFASDTLEALTKCAWYVPLLFWVPVICYELRRYAQLMGGWAQLDAPLMLGAGAVGVLCWLLFEYVLHRYIFHLRTESYAMNIFHFLIHGHHHITPMDFDRLVFPPVPAMIIASPFYFGGPWLLGDRVGYPWILGLCAGYLMYDMTHFFIHHHVPKNHFFKMLKRRHVFHHYFDPRVNYGISNPLFDYVFGTIKEPR